MKGKPSFATGNELFMRELSNSNVLLNRLKKTLYSESASNGLLIFEITDEPYIFWATLSMVRKRIWPDIRWPEVNRCDAVGIIKIISGKFSEAHSAH